MNNKPKTPSLKGLMDVAKTFGVQKSDFNVVKPYDWMSPTIIEERPMNMAVLDIFSRLIMDRIIFIGDGIDEQMSNIVMSQLLYLDSTGNQDISVYINSPGGSVYDGNGILDVMDFVQCNVRTICTGLAASMAAIILSNGEKGKRYALPRSRVMIHQPSISRTGGSASDLQITVNELNRIKTESYETLSKNTGKTVEEIEKLCDRDKWYSAKEAKEDLNIIDDILYKKKN